MLRWNDLSDEIRLDGKFPVFAAAVYQHGQLYLSRAAKVHQLVKRSTDRPPGIKDVVDEDDGLVLNIFVQFRPVYDRVRANSGEVIAVKCDIDDPVLRTAAFQGTLGAPVMEPPGKEAWSRSSGPRPLRNSPSTAEASTRSSATAPSTPRRSRSTRSLARPHASSKPAERPPSASSAPPKPPRASKRSRRTSQAGGTAMCTRCSGGSR